MKSATDLLAELLRVYDDPDKSTAQLYLWVHQQQDEIREVVEGGLQDTERLDWLEADAPRYDHDPEARIERVRAFWWDGRPSSKARAAIDRARGEGES